jgi:hypothetical protein
MTMIKPQLGILLVLLPLVRRSGRALAGVATTLLLLAAVSLAIFGTSGMGAWWNLLLSQSEVGGGTFVRPWLSLRGPLLWLGLSTAAQYAVLAALGAALVALLAWRRGDLRRDFAAATAGALLVTPHANAHDLALLIVPGMVIATGRGLALIGGAYVGATAAIWVPVAAPLASLAILARLLREGGRTRATGGSG